MLAIISRLSWKAQGKILLLLAINILNKSYLLDIEFFIITETLFLNSFSWLILTLTYWVIHISWWASIYVISLKKIFNLVNSLLLSLTLVFIVDNFVWFYFFFELSLLPIFFIIMGWGYQPERLNAGKLMFLYTACASLPLLAALLYASQIYSDPSISKTLSLTTTPVRWHVIWLASNLAFLVKFPMFMTHLWLPKAHVEAPVMGSTILAGILLKLGGLGVVRTAPILFRLSYVNILIINFRLLGGAWVAIMCLQQTDIKVLIAYSSVSHIRVAIAGILSQTSIGYIFGALVLVRHGLASTLIFMGSSTMYSITNRRILPINKGFLILIPQFRFLWATICVSNFGGPPFINLWVELGAFIAIMAHSVYLTVPLAIMALTTFAYSLILYTSTQGGKPSKPATFAPKFFIRDFSIFTSTAILSVRAGLVFINIPMFKSKLNLSLRAHDSSMVNPFC